MAHYTDFPGAWGGLTSQRRGGASGYFGFDSQASTRILVSEAGVVTDRYAFTGFGEEIAASGSTPNPYRYGGAFGYRRQQAGWSYVRARVLESADGRWISRDPIGFLGGDWNLYGYVGNQPVRFVDPSGHFRIYSPIAPTQCRLMNIIALDPGDISSVVVSRSKSNPKRGILIPYREVFAAAGVPFSAHCITVNGGFFDPPRGAYRPGAPATPIGDVRDQRGAIYPGSPWSGNTKVVTDSGWIMGRLPRDPGHTDQELNRARTGVCVDANGKVKSIMLYPPAGIRDDVFDGCMRGNCPDGTHPVFLDGGGSTQLVLNGNPPKPLDPFCGQGRAVHNWIVICPPGTQQLLRRDGR